RPEAPARGAREDGGADLQPPVRDPPLQPPAVVDIYVAIAELCKPRIHQRLRRAEHLLLIDLGPERIPAVPTHRRSRRSPARVRGPAAGGRQGIGGGGGGSGERQRRRDQKPHQCGCAAGPSSRTQMFLKLIGALGSPCAWSLIGEGP